MQKTQGVPHHNDAYFLDRMIAHHNETIILTEVAQRKSINLDLKKMARKIKRTNRRQLVQMEDWRRAYYQDIPEYWVLPSKTLSDVTKYKGSDFELNFLEIMIKHDQEGLKRLERASENSQKTFIRTYARKWFKEIKERIERLSKLKQELSLY